MTARDADKRFDVRPRACLPAVDHRTRISVLMAQFRQKIASYLIATARWGWASQYRRLPDGVGHPL